MEHRYYKKGNSAFTTMKTGALAIGVAFIVAGVVATILSELSSNLTGDALAVVGNGTAGILELAGFGAIFGVVLAVVIILSLVSMIKLGKGN